MKKEIWKLLEKYFFEKPIKHSFKVIGSVNKKQARLMEKTTGINLYGCSRVLDTSAIQHIFKKHGSAHKENNRGQIAVTVNDILNINHYIINAFEINYKGKNKLKQDVFEYKYRINGIIAVLDAVVINKRGNKLYIQTMYKTKK